MGVFANLPLALAPGIGVNTLLIQWCFYGSGNVPCKSALTVIFLEGLVFLFIFVIGLRAKLTKFIPKPVRMSCSTN